MITDVYKILMQIGETSKRNDKIEILQQHKGNALLKMVIEYALNPFIKFHVRKIPEYKPNRSSDIALANVLKKLSVLSERKLTGNKAIDWLRSQLEMLDKYDAYLLECIIGKDLKCGIAASTVNKVWPKLIPEYPCMLCSQADEKTLSNINYPAIAQEKLDGMRINPKVDAGTVTYSSRNGNEVDLNGHLHEQFIKLSHGRNVVFDGEVLVKNANGKGYMRRKNGNGIINKAIMGTISEEELKRVVIVLWDIVAVETFEDDMPSMPYTKRFAYLKKIIEELNHPQVLLVDWVEVESFYEAKQYFNKVVSRGGEGLILKNWRHLWENKRSKDLIKMKVEEECDLIIVDIAEGEGRNKGKLGAFVCESADGKLRVNVGSGFSDEQRDTLFSDSYKGKIVAVKYNEKIEREGSDEISLFLPIFIEVRTDKDVADTIDRIK